MPGGFGEAQRAGMIRGKVVLGENHADQLSIKQKPLFRGAFLTLSRLVARLELRAPIHPHAPTHSTVSRIASFREAEKESA